MQMSATPTCSIDLRRHVNIHFW